MNKDVLVVDQIITELKQNSRVIDGAWYIGNSRCGFGLGCFQWTFDRLYDLMNMYKQKNGCNRNISESQVIDAEISMIENEFMLASYDDILGFWKEQCDIDLNSSITANKASYIICTHYLIPKNVIENAEKRAEYAETIYSAMVK